MKNYLFVVLVFLSSCNINNTESKSSESLKTGEEKQDTNYEEDYTKYKEVNTNYNEGDTLHLGVFYGQKLNKSHVDSLYNNLYNLYKEGTIDSEDLFTIRQILFHHDPENKIGTDCGVLYTNCKWCNNPIEYKGTIKGESDDFGFFLFSHEINEEYDRLPIPDTTSTKNTRFIKRLKEFLNNYRLSNGLTCEGDRPLFCSLKCKTEYKDRFGREY